MTDTLNTRFRLYLGLNRPDGTRVTDTDLDVFLAEVSEHFPGFTLYFAKGYWKGQSEPSVTLEILAREEQTPVVQFLAARYVATQGQESALVTSEPLATIDFVTLTPAEKELER